MNAIAFTAKQKQMLTLPHKTWNIFTGAVRSGKSYGTMFLIPQRIGAHYTQPCLIVGKTLATVERNVLRPLRTIFGGYDVGDIKGRADGGRYVTLWGKEVDCVGANDERAISKIHGAEYGYAYCDEMTLYPENFFRMLQSRLSLPNSECDGTCNPDSPSHYLKQFLDSPAFAKNGNCIHFTIYDNEFLPKDYVQRLEDEYRGTIYFDRWILGKWVRTEGLVFPLFRRERNFLTLEEYARRNPGKTTSIRYVIWGGDGATTNDATAIVPLAILADGRAVVLESFYHDPKVNGQMSNEQLVPFLRDYLDYMNHKYRLYETGVQHCMPIDCAAADLVQTMRYHFPQYNPISFTRKDIQRTTDVVNNAFSREAITIIDSGGWYNWVQKREMAGIQPLVVELETMIWNDDNSDVVRKTYDGKIPNDAADAFRYAVNTYYNNPLNLWETPACDIPYER